MGCYLIFLNSFHGSCIYLGAPVYINLLFSFTSLIILFRVTLTFYLIVSSQSRVSFFPLLYISYVTFLSFYAFLHNKTSCLQTTYSIINMCRRSSPPTSLFSRPYTLSFLLATYFIYILHSQLRSPYVYTNASRPFLSPH